MEFSITKSFAYALIVYIIALAYGLNFIFSNLALGGLTADFWLVALIILLPLLFFVLYFLKGSIEFVGEHETLFRRLIVIFTVIATLFVVFFIVPIAY